MWIHKRPGKREREARKRHRRVIISFLDFENDGDLSGWTTLKLGSKKLRQYGFCAPHSMKVAEPEIGNDRRALVSPS